MQIKQLVKIFFSGGFIAVLLSVIFLASVKTLRPVPAPKPQGTALLNIIPAPTVTLFFPTLMPTDTAPPPSDSGSDPLYVGAFIQIHGTGELGLRIRSTPSLNSEVLYLGIETEVFQIMEGPVYADDYTWWRLLNPYNQEIEGWAVSNYLRLIQNP